MEEVPQYSYLIGNLSGILRVISLVAVLPFAVYLHRRAKAHPKNRSLFYFSRFLSWMTFFFFLVAIPHLFTYEEKTFFRDVVLRHMHTAVVFFYYVASAYFARLTAYIFYPQYEKRIFNWLIVAAVVGILLSLAFPHNEPHRGESGFIFWTHHWVSFAAIGTISMVAYLPGIYLFFRQGLKSADRLVRYRSLIISIGFLIFFIGGAMHDMARTATTYLVADVLASIFALVIVAVVAPRFFREGEMSSQPRT